MTAIGMWFRIEWRNRWRALVGLLLLIAFATASVQAAAAGARRGATAVDRLIDRTQPATLLVLLNRGAFDWDQVRAMPEVEAVSAFAVSGFAVEGLGEHPEVDPGDLAAFPPVDDDLMDTIERPVVLEGRLPDPSRADEVVVSPGFVEYFDRGVGDTATLRLYSADQVDSLDEGPPMGPTVDVTIVGVVRSPWLSDSADRPYGGLQVSAGLHERYPDNVVGTAGAVNVNAIVRLHGGADAVRGFEEEFARLTGIENAEFDDRTEVTRHARDVTRFEARALLLLALTALLASTVLLGVAISRYCSTSRPDLDVLRAFGLATREAHLSVAVGPTTAAIGGVLVAGAAAIGVSRWFPIGSAAYFEPSPGTSIDPVVLLPALIVVPGFVAVVSMLSARTRTPSAPNRISLAESITAGWPVSLGLGTRLAVAGRSTGSTASARPALLAAVVGVAGVVGALTFADGITDATNGFDRFGQTYDLGTFLGAGGQDFVDPASTLGAVAADPGVDGVLDVANESARTESGSVSLFTYAPVGEPVDVVVTEGRLPATPAEVALAPRSAEQAGVGVGDPITLTGSSGSLAMTVSGIAFVPAGPHNGYASGGWVLPAAFEELFDGFRFHFGLVSTDPDTDPQTVVDRLAASGVELFPGPIIPPTERGELEELLGIPTLLAGFLAVLGVGAVAHALASTARRRRHDVAMLRALGMRPRDTAAIVFVQASVIALIGLAIGLPAGIASGRAIWRSVASNTPIEVIVPGDWAMVGLTALAAVATATVLAIWPSRRLATLRLASELRSE